MLVPVVSGIVADLVSKAESSFEGVGGGEEHEVIANRINVAADADTYERSRDVRTMQILSSKPVSLPGMTSVLNIAIKRQTVTS